MPVCECENCGGHYAWDWEEAFAKFGFGNGQRQVETWQVEEALTAAGYAVTVEDWGCHNRLIVSIRKGGRELIPYDTLGFGYVSPRRYLPNAIVSLLDRALPPSGRALSCFD